MTEAVQIALIVAVGPTLAVIVTGIVQLKTAWAAAARVEAVATDLAISNMATDTTLEQIKATGETTHKLVNGALTAQMKVAAVALRRVADVTGDDGDSKAAQVAEDALAEHIAKQPKVGND